ncbi:MAG: IS30 family transposase, partial [Paracoccaceae bacterium]
DGHYSPQAGRRVHDARRLRSRRPRRLVEGGALHTWVHGKLVHLHWSPEQIAGRLGVMHPDDPDQRVSHETTYAAIYAQPRGGLKAAMIEALRQRKPARGRRRTTLAGSSMVPETLRITHRPEEIDERIVLGHWERDLIKGAFNRSSVGTLVERKTRFVVLCKMDGNTAAAALEAFTRQMKRLPAAMRKSMTYDRGIDPLVLQIPRLSCDCGATARHVIYDGQWRGSDRSPLGHTGPRMSMVAPVFSFDLPLSDASIACRPMERIHGVLGSHDKTK